MCEQYNNLSINCALVGYCTKLKKEEEEEEEELVELNRLFLQLYVQ